MYIPRKFALTADQTADALAAPSSRTGQPALDRPAGDAAAADLRRVTAFAHRPRLPRQPALACRRRRVGRDLLWPAHVHLAQLLRDEIGDRQGRSHLELRGAQRHGRLAIHDDPEWVLNLVTMLTDRHEARRPAPWQVTDAPQAYTQSQLRGIVGVELVIADVEGKAKMSQNQPERNRAGVVAGSQGVRRAAGSARRRPGGRLRRPQHERERPGIAQPGQPRAPHRVHIDGPHLARRRFVALQRLPVGADDQHPVPGNEATDQHRDRPAGLHIAQTSVSRSCRPRNNRHRYLTPRTSVRVVSARAMPIGVVPSMRGQTRFTRLHPHCSSSNHAAGRSARPVADPRCLHRPRPGTAGGLRSVSTRTSAPARSPATLGPSRGEWHVVARPDRHVIDHQGRPKPRPGRGCPRRCSSSPPR